MLIADGMFAILVPASLAPLIITLFWAERKAKKLGLVNQISGHPGESAPPLKPSHRSPAQRIWKFIDQLDLVGLLILGAAVALILLPLTLSQTAKGGWHNRGSCLVWYRSTRLMRVSCKASMIAMLVVGIVLLFGFTMWDSFVAQRPVVPFRFWKNRSFIGAAWIGFFDFVSPHFD